ncbi:MAG: lipopolysaccharide kinase InaA family protein [Planctomycetota bacterium]
MSADGDQTLHKASLAKWRERIVMRLGDRTVYLKRYDRPPMREQLRQRLRGFSATAELEWHWLRQLPALGIAAPAPLAWGSRKRGWREHQSLLLMAEVPGRSLERWVPDEIDGRLAVPAFRTRLGTELADVVGRLHGAGLIHRDLYLSHIFLDEPRPGAVGIALIDLHRVIRPPLRRRRWVVKDLAALNYSTPAAAASLTDRVRWFKRYRGIARLSRPDKSLIRAIVRKTRRMTRHSQKHGLG